MHPAIVTKTIALESFSNVSRSLVSRGTTLLAEPRNKTIPLTARISNETAIRPVAPGPSNRSITSTASIRLLDSTGFTAGSLSVTCWFPTRIANGDVPGASCEKAIAKPITAAARPSADPKIAAFQSRRQNIRIASGPPNVGFIVAIASATPARYGLRRAQCSAVSEASTNSNVAWPKYRFAWPGRLSRIAAASVAVIAMLGTRPHQRHVTYASTTVNPTLHNHHNATLVDRGNAANGSAGTKIS